MGAPPNRSDYTVNGVRCRVLQTGPSASEEAAVFIHGNPGFSADWDDIATRAGRFMRCVAPDMPGYGDAERPDSFNYTVEGYADYLDGLLAQLAVRKVHLILHDFGGPWGLAWAIRNRDAVRSLTLINTGLLPGYTWHRAAQIWRTPGVGEAFMAAVTRTSFHLLMKPGNPRGLPAEFVDAMYEKFDSGMKRAVLRLYRATNNLGEITDRARDAFRGSAFPVLVIWGAADPYLPVRYAEIQREFFPQAKVEIFEDSGHWPHADNPERAAEVVLPFLQEALGQASAVKPA
jgi:pimeloyl-ACP methyl ester carboxylesterase